MIESPTANDAFMQVGQTETQSAICKSQLAIRELQKYTSR